MDPCPNDTNGDGNCGQRACPYCGEQAPVLHIASGSLLPEGLHCAACALSPDEVYRYRLTRIWGDRDEQLYCVKRTRDGYPGHPGRLANDIQPLAYP